MLVAEGKRRLINVTPVFLLPIKKQTIVLRRNKNSL